MADHASTPAFSPIISSSADGLANLDNHGNDATARPSRSAASPDSTTLLDNRIARSDSIESLTPSEDAISQSPSASAPDTSTANFHGWVVHDSQTHLASHAPPEASATAKPVLVSSTQIPRPQNGVHLTAPAGHNKVRSARHTFLPWKFELFAALLAIGLLVCEVVVLAHYDGKFLFEHWPHDWKINAVFAFLTTILEAAIMFYVGACIGQLRWYWFKKKQHRLDWLEIMTEARQPPGAMRLLVRKGMQRYAVAFHYVATTS